MRASSANARLVQRHERRKAQSAAKASSARFSAKQSRFQLRQEEINVLNAAQQESDSAPSAITAPNRDQSATFSRFERSSARSPATAGATPTTTATFGLSSPSRTTNVLGMGGIGSRSARRAAKFRLDDAEGAAQQYGDGQVVGGLLGAARRPRENEAAQDESDANSRKKTRAEKFQEVMANSKEHRSHLQREREQGLLQTKAIDDEFNGVFHLLERRDKIKEEVDAFKASGTPEVRALLQSFRKGHVAKTLAIRSDGSYTVTPLSGPEGVQGEPAVAAPATVAKGAEEGLSSFLDKADMELLERIRSGTAKREVAPEVNNAGIASQVVEPERSRIAAASEKDQADVDEFDRMMHVMRLETRRAIAGDRTLTEEEEKQQLLEQQLLEEDRGAVPSVSHNREQPTRAELLKRGGDFPEMGEGYDSAGDAECDDNLDISSAYDSDAASRRSGDEEEGRSGGTGEGGFDVERGAGGLGTLEKLLGEIEVFSRENCGSPSARAARGEAYHLLLTRLYRYAQTHALHTAQTFRTFLIEAQRTFLRRGSCDRATLLLLYTTSRIFPMTDYRHGVTTPFFLFLSSLLLQMKLTSIAQARDYAVLAGLMCSCMLEGGKFCAEAIIAPLNLIALQVPRTCLEPTPLQGVCVPFPLVGRGERDVALLLTDDTSGPAEHVESINDNGKEGSTVADRVSGNSGEGNGEVEPPLKGTLAILETNISAERIVRYAYRLLSEQAEALHYLPAFDYCLAEPFLALHKRLEGATAPLPVTKGKRSRSADDKFPAHWKPSAAVRADHEALLEKMKLLSHDARSRRTPLMMRSFRPRPIRQFDPLLQAHEDAGGKEGMSTSALKSEVRLMKREIREDRKRVVRHLQAEANVERRQRERVAMEVEAQRERKYRELMGSLQAQQHIMKTVDGLQAKARSKKRKSISGLPGKEDGDFGGAAGEAT